MKSQKQADIDQLNLKLIKLENEKKENIAKISASLQDKLQQLRDNYDNEVIPELKQNHSRIITKQE